MRIKKLVTKSLVIALTVMTFPFVAKVAQASSCNLSTATTSIGNDNQINVSLKLFYYPNDQASIPTEKQAVFPMNLYLVDKVKSSTLILPQLTAADCVDSGQTCQVNKTVTITDNSSSAPIIEAQRRSSGLSLIAHSKSDTFDCTAAQNITFAASAAQTTPPTSTGGTSGGAAQQAASGQTSTTPFDTLTQDKLNEFNPLVQFSDSANAKALSTPGGILSRFLLYAFPIAGLILFVMLLWAGFEMLSGAATKKSLDAGRQRATAAIIGFLLLFASYWIVKVVEVVFGIKIF